MRIRFLIRAVSVAATYFSLAPLIAVAQIADAPKTIKVDPGKLEKPCDSNEVQWRKAQVIEGVKIKESLRCRPDDPNTVAAVVKGTNNISMDTLMETYLAADSVIKKDDKDGDGDPDLIIIKLEVMELNGHSPDFQGVVPTFDIAPGVQPAMWVFAPKSRGMSTMSFASIIANPLLRAPSPAIRVEQDDVVWIQLENTHYFPHTIHLHGVDHPYVDSQGEGNDGVPQTSDKYVMPATRRTYEIKPRQTGTMFYHCHVQTHNHLAMGMVGMFIVEENRPNNWLQTLNIGAGQVRQPSVAVREKYDQEYDLHYHAIDKQLEEIVQGSNDPRLIARKMNREYDLTDSTEDYHTLNGRSYPYTLRESLITVEPDQNVKIRMLNSQGEMIAIHTHGHKAKITHYDGIEHNPESQITRDVYDLAPAQRVDMELSTVDDGLHSYGKGIWIFHDHREKGITTDGMNPGGNVSAVVYKEYLNKEGMPKAQGADISAYFGEKFHARQLPIWQNLDDLGTLGDVIPQPVQAATGGTAGKASADQTDVQSSNSVLSFVVGLLLGILVYLAILNRQRIEKIAHEAVSMIRGSKDDNT